MRYKLLNNTAVDLQAENVPFNPGSTFLALNLTAGTLVVQEALDSAFTAPVTVASILTNEGAQITPTLQYLRVSTSANILLIGN
jgi:hypothetical protein